ncbi:hypothetical protein ACNOIU_15705 (plasmid) [Exiguobacterium mexicanum]
MKDLVDQRLALNLTEVRLMVNAYIDYYNSEGQQWNLKKMIP